MVRLEESLYVNEYCNVVVENFYLHIIFEIGTQRMKNYISRLSCANCSTVLPVRGKFELCRVVVSLMKSFGTSRTSSC